MQKIEGRKWLPGKETYDEYAIDKLALMHRVDLKEKDKIYLLIGGIALSVKASTVDTFMEHMRRIAHGVAEQDRKPSSERDGQTQGWSLQELRKERSRAQELQR